MNNILQDNLLFKCSQIRYRKGFQLYSENYEIDVCMLNKSKNLNHGIRVIENVSHYLAFKNTKQHIKYKSTHYATDNKQFYKTHLYIFSN